MANSKVLDLAIIGSGIGAITAAIYAAREKLSVQIFEKELVGGLTATISKIENFPAFTGTGAELVKLASEQAKNFGAKISYGECSQIKKKQDIFELTIDDAPVLAKSVLVATGSERRRLGIPGEELSGVSYCATCDGPLTSGRDVIVIGGGNSAVQEAFYLLKYCDVATVINRSPLRCDRTLARRVENEARIKLEVGYTPIRIDDRKGAGLNLLCQDNLRSKPDGELITKTFKASAIFIFVGMIPATRFLPAEVLHSSGQVETDTNFQTSIPGLFAAGDCRYGNTKQSIVAAGEGASAAVNIGKYLESLKKQDN